MLRCRKVFSSLCFLCLAFLIGCQASAATKQYKILVLGDSFASDLVWPTKLAQMLGEGTRCDVHAKVGATSYDLLRWVNGDTHTKPIDFYGYTHIILMAGVNDSAPVVDVVNNLQYILWVAKELNPAILTIVIQYPDWHRYASWDINREYALNGILRCLQKGEHTDLYVETRGGQLGPDDQSDGLHLNDAGKTKLAAMLCRSIRSR